MQDQPFYLVPANEPNWGCYSGLCQQQLGYDPLRHDKTVFIASKGLDDYIAAGCVLIASDGAYLIVDGYVVHPNLSAIDKYNITVFFQDEIKKIAAFMNRVVVVLVGHDGLRGVLEKHGYEQSQAELWFHLPDNTAISPEYSALQERPSEGQIVGEDPDNEENVIASVPLTENVLENFTRTVNKDFDFDGNAPFDSTERYRMAASGDTFEQQDVEVADTSEKRKPGRPKGAKNKKKRQYGRQGRKAS
jgi:hypothetical protein